MSLDRKISENSALLLANVPQFSIIFDQIGSRISSLTKPIGVARYPAKFMWECRSFTSIKLSFDKTEIIRVSLKSALFHKFCRVSRYASTTNLYLMHNRKVKRSPSGHRNTLAQVFKN